MAMTNLPFQIRFIVYLCHSEWKSLREDLPFEEPEVMLIYLVFALVLERRVRNINCWRE
jgi:hypothetical protein